MSIEIDRPRITVTLQDLGSAGVSLPYDNADADGRRVVALDIGTDDARVQLLDEVGAVCAVIDLARELLHELPPTGVAGAVQSSRAERS